MSYLSTSSQASSLQVSRRAAILAPHIAPAADQNGLFSQSVLHHVAVHHFVRPANPKLKLLAVAASIIALHMGIWFAVEHVPQPAHELPKPKPVIIELIKPLVQKPPLPLPQKIVKPKVPPLVDKPKPVKQEVIKQTKAPVEPRSKPEPIKSTQPPEPVAIPSPTPLSTPAATVAIPSPVPSPVAAVSAPAKQETVTEAKGYAGYLNNPAPDYPEQALERGWEGQVILRIHVQPSGKPSEVSVKKTSGRKVLDDTAVRTVKRWTFSPALRGSTATEGWVDVPLDFKLPSE